MQCESNVKLKAAMHVIRNVVLFEEITMNCGKLTIETMLRPNICQPLHPSPNPLYPNLKTWAQSSATGLLLLESF